MGGRTMGQRTPATVQDIARRAGISAGSVSRILNGKNKENRPSTVRLAAKVRRIASQLGYRPNAAARSMLKGRFGLIAFVTCGDAGTDWIPRSLVHGIHQAAEDADLRVVMSEFHRNRLGEADYVPRLLKESVVDGLIVYLDPRVQDLLLPQLEATRQAVVFTNSQRFDRAVYPKDMEGSKRATEELIAAGRKRIAYLRFDTGGGGAGGGHYSHVDRREGYLQAMREAGLKPVVWELPATKEVVPERAGIVEAALAAAGKVDGLVCYEQNEAVSAYVAATRLGRKVPKDLAIVGFHEREVRSVTGIGIPTAVVPFYEVGLEATRMLIRMIETGVHSEASRGVEYGVLKT